MTPEERRIRAAALEEAVLRALADGGRAATYVVRNTIAMRGWWKEGGPLTTPMVLRSLKRLERVGNVKRVPSSYVVMLTWTVTSLAQKEPQQ